jgi:endo-alpha-1,4-polygalactosaminidase (GH114 family)
MIDAEFRSEERFSRLSLAYECESEKESVCAIIERITSKYAIKPETYTTVVSSGKKVLVIEYHDDCYREAGNIFEEIMQSLDIKACL